MEGIEHSALSSNLLKTELPREREFVIKEDTEIVTKRIGRRTLFLIVLVSNRKLSQLNHHN
jgi:hypothetical protein